MKLSFEALGAADIPFFSSRLVFFRFPGASLLSSSLCALDFVRSRLLLLAWCILCNNRHSAQSSAVNLLSSEKARLLLGARIQVWHRLSAKFFFVRPQGSGGSALVLHWLSFEGNACAAPKRNSYVSQKSY